MTKPISFDVLIVYNHNIAQTASATSEAISTPFPNHSSASLYNYVYAYFLQVCHQYKLTAALTTSADIVGPGRCSSYWQYSRNFWSKVNSPGYSTLIFDKFSPIKKSDQLLRRLLFSSALVKSFNDPNLFTLFFDKQKTYLKFSDYSIPTVPLVSNTSKSIKNAYNKLVTLINHHSGSQDFSQDIVMKDRFGAGGRRVYKFKPSQLTNMLAIARKHKNISYIIQPFTNFDQGFSYNGRSTYTDIRLIYFKGKIIQSYIRVAKPGEFRCNEHRGGLLTYLSLDQLPPSLVTRSNLLSHIINQNDSLYTLDFIISNLGNIYFLEGNTNPGLDWNITLKNNEFEAKKLINLIVEELAVRTSNLSPIKTNPLIGVCSENI